MNARIFKTANGKEVTTFIDPINAHYRIKFLSGGELPEELSGLFTSVSRAEIAITRYISKGLDKETKKKETTSKEA